MLRINKDVVLSLKKFWFIVYHNVSLIFLYQSYAIIN